MVSAGVADFVTVAKTEEVQLPKTDVDNARSVLRDDLHDEIHRTLEDQYSKALSV